MPDMCLGHKHPTPLTHTNSEGYRVHNCTGCIWWPPLKLKQTKHPIPFKIILGSIELELGHIYQLLINQWCAPLFLCMVPAMTKNSMRQGGKNAPLPFLYSCMLDSDLKNLNWYDKIYIYINTATYPYAELLLEKFQHKTSWILMYRLPLPQPVVSDSLFCDIRLRNIFILNYSIHN